MLEGETWPFVDTKDGMLPVHGTVPGLIHLPIPSTTDHFGQAELDPRWISLRGPASGLHFNSGTPGVHLNASTAELSSMQAVSMIAQRLRQPASRSRACIQVDQASPDGRYGVVLFLHETAFMTLAIEQAGDGSTVLRLRQHIVLLQGQSAPDLDPRGDIIASCPYPTGKQTINSS